MATYATHFSPLFLLPLTAPLAAEPGSLLDALLQEAPMLGAALSNVAQNLGTVDASFALSVERDIAALAIGLDTWAAGRESVAAGLTVNAIEAQGSALSRVDRLAVELGPIATTAVGSLQSANLTGSFSASGLTERIELTADTASLTVEARGSVAGLVALQNVSMNAGTVIGAVELHLADTDALLDNITATALGALQNGALNTSADLSATVQGQMGEITATTAAVVAALVGS